VGMNGLKRILVVDDEERDRFLLEAMLDSFGYTTELARNGTEALDKLDSSIDLVLLDMLMPGLGGLEVTCRIRNRPDYRNVPIVMVTALTRKEDRVQAIAVGANDFISKPIDRTELQVRLASLLKIKDAQDALRHSEEKYRTLVETARDVIWTVDLDLRYTYVSPSVTDVLGYTVEEIMSMHPLDGFTPVSRETVIRGFNEELALEAATPGDRHASRTEEIERYHKDGSTRWTEITMRFLRDDSGKPVGVMGISHDITERKQMEEALRKARDELEQRVEERTAELVRANEQLAQEITDRKRAEEALRESEERHRALFEGAADGILVADVETKRLNFANPSMCNMLGYTMEEMVRLKVCDIHPAASVPQVIAEFEAQGREEKVLVPNVPCVRKDGSVFYADIVGRPVVIEKRRMNVGFFSDITERKKMEDSLRRNEARFRGLIDQAADAIFVHDFDGRFVEVNRQACTSLGYTRDDLLSMSVSDVDPDGVPRGDSAKFWPNLPATFEARHRRKDGTTFPVEVRLAAIEYGETKVLLATARDLTDRKRAEELAIQSTRLRAIADLSSGVAHHFNNLLQIVIGNTSLSLADLESGDLSEIKTNLEQMLRAATLGAETVKRLQTFANMRADVTESESVVFDIATTARNAAKVSKPVWKSDPEKKGIKIEVQLDLEDGCLVKGQENEMFEVLVNLIRNAAEAMPQGGNVAVKTYREADEVLISVRDSGTGIAEEDLSKVFHPFWSSRGVGIGKGMGLAVTHGLVKRHGGSISVDSKLGVGTNFTVRLPLAQEPVRKTVQTATLATEDHLTILVIEDELNIATLLERICAKAGHRVFKALSGQEGLAIFNKEPVDLVISDLGMPGMNGWDVGKAIRSICQERGVSKPPFILLTGYGGQELQKENIAESGIDAVVAKPIDRATVLATVQRIAGRLNIRPRVT
jgi:PAS domain S-box-containing protein